MSSKKVKRKAKHVDEWGWAYAHIPKKQQVSASARHIEVPAKDADWRMHTLQIKYWQIKHGIIQATTEEASADERAVALTCCFFLKKLTSSSNHLYCNVKKCVEWEGLTLHQWYRENIQHFGSSNS